MVAEALALKIYIDLLNQLVKDIRQKKCRFMSDKCRKYDMIFVSEKGLK